MAVTGIIGGSGLYQLDNFVFSDKIKVKTPFGLPSDEIVIGNVGDKKVAFLPRHGTGHIFTPTEVNYRANIYALKKVGVDRIISVSAVGSMKEKIVPGQTLLLPDQFIDLTKNRINSFFGNGIVAHVSFADPVCSVLSQTIHDAGLRLGYEIIRGGTYLNIEGPQFSTKAESLLYKSWGVDVIGMTNATEAKLAREAEICYSSINIATDYDCWKYDEEAVSVDAIVKRLLSSIEDVKKILKKTIEMLPDKRDNCLCESSLKDAIITDWKKVPKETLENLSLLINRYMEK